MRVPWSRWESCSHAALTVLKNRKFAALGRAGGRERRDSFYENILLSVASASKTKQINIISDRT